MNKLKNNSNNNNPEKQKKRMKYYLFVQRANSFMCVIA